MTGIEGTIRCEEALRLLAAYLDGELSRQEHLNVERHLEACRSCFSRAEFERHLHARLTTLGRREPDRDVGARFRELIRRFTRAAESNPQRD